MDAVETPNPPPAQKEKEHWTVDKRVPVAVVWAVGLQVLVFLAGGTGFYLTTGSRLSSLEASAKALSDVTRDLNIQLNNQSAGQERRITVLETKSDNTDRDLQQIVTTVNQINAKFDNFLVRTITQPHSQGQ